MLLLIFRSYMRLLLTLLIALPMALRAQTTDTTHKKTKRVPEGFAMVGYISEVWTLTNKMNSVYNSATYKGNGAIMGGGFKTRTDAKHPVGYSGSIGYVRYAMEDKLATTEKVLTTYNYLRLSPSICYLMYTGGELNFHLAGDAALMLPGKGKMNNYIQLGMRAIVGRGAYSMELGYYFSPGRVPPPSDLTNRSWKDQCFMFSIVCYPSRIPDWGKVRNYFK